jgi:hypothetical protein
MKPEIKKKWVKALKSGKYEKTTGALCIDGKFCCLGVLTDIYAKEHGLSWKTSKNGEGRLEGTTKTLDLPPKVREWAGIKEASPKLKKKALKFKGEIMLEKINDSTDATFYDIAKLIDEQL